MGIALRRIPPARLLVLVVLLGVIAAAVWFTVGPLSAVAAPLIVAVDRRISAERRLLATSAVVALTLVPVLWFVGTGLPLTPPAARIQDNVLAHEVGGLAVWLLFLAVLLDRGDRPTPSSFPTPLNRARHKGTYTYERD